MKENYAYKKDELDFKIDFKSPRKSLFKDRYFWADVDSRFKDLAMAKIEEKEKLNNETFTFRYTNKYKYRYWQMTLKDYILNANWERWFSP